MNWHQGREAEWLSWWSGLLYLSLYDGCSYISIVALNSCSFSCLDEAVSLDLVVFQAFFGLNGLKKLDPFWSLPQLKMWLTVQLHVVVFDQDKGKYYRMVLQTLVIVSESSFICTFRFKWTCCRDYICIPTKMTLMLQNSMWPKDVRLFPLPGEFRTITIEPKHEVGEELGSWY